MSGGPISCRSQRAATFGDWRRQGSNLFLLNRDAMGRYGANAIRLIQTQCRSSVLATESFLRPPSGITPVYRTSRGRLQAYPFSTSAGQFNAGSATSAGVSFGFPGARPPFLQVRVANGIVWATEAACSALRSPRLRACRASRLDATNSPQNSGTVSGRE